MLKTGFISYLNAYPYYYPFQQMSAEERHGWEFTLGKPATLNGMLRRGELDLSLVSLMEYAARPDDYRLVRGTGLSSSGYVDSVSLLCQKPLEDLEHCEIRTTDASATSVSVMHILLREKGIENFTCRPYKSEKGIPREAEAVLTIGDEALTQACEKSFPYHYDLGEMWQKLFNRSIVFAVCAIRRDALENKLPQISSFVEALQKAPDRSFADGEIFRGHCRAQFPSIEAPMTYLRRLEFHLGDAESADMQFFLDKARKHGLIPHSVTPQYFKPPLEIAAEAKDSPS
jgi:chorismate dehydratase